MSKVRDYQDLTWIATIVGAHGIKGAVRVKPFANDPGFYLKCSKFHVEISGELKIHYVKNIFSNKTGWILLFDEYDTRNQAEELRGCRLLLPDDELKPLETNEFFVHDIIGCKVEDTEGNILGSISEMLETGANHVYEVCGGKVNFLVPDVPHVVKELDVINKRMIIDPMPGMMDDSTSEGKDPSEN